MSSGHRVVIKNYFRLNAMCRDISERQNISNGGPSFKKSWWSGALEIEKSLIAQKEYSPPPPIWRSRATASKLSVLACAIFSAFRVSSGSMLAFNAWRLILPPRRLIRMLDYD